MDLASDKGVPPVPRGRLDPKQLPNVRSLGKGLFGFIYETSWFARGRYARKDFPLRSLKRRRIFEEEANVLLELDHQNLVRCFGYTRGKSSSSLLREYVDDNLQNIVQRRIEAQRVSSPFHSQVVDDIEEIKHLLSSKDKGTTGLDDGNTLQFEMHEAENIISQIAAGMKYLHDKEIAHGDLKPKNVLLYLDKTKAVKLADYGLQRTKKLIKLVSKRTRRFEILTWKAPECLEELLGPVADDPFTDSDIDSDEDIERYDKFLESRLAKADVYSFGLTCSYILGARLVFPKLSLTQLQEQRMHDLERISILLPATYPEHLRSLIVSCMRSDPSSRPTFSDICDTLKEDGGARGSTNTNLYGGDVKVGSLSKYDVFLNHRGPDLKKTFVSHLNKALHLAGCEPFLDVKSLVKGNHAFNSIDEALSGARVHVAIFSQRYAESRYCLNELCDMLASGKPVIPVFYDVEPEHLRWRKVGPFAEAFHSHMMNWRVGVVMRWKEALHEVTNISGLRLVDCDNDTVKLEEKIVGAVLNALSTPPLRLAGHSVGLG